MAEMDMKEKLVELLGADVCKHDSCDNCECKGSTDMCIATLKAYMADHLIQNGVTFAKNTNVPDNNVGKWIPVTERLPEIPEGWAESPEPLLYMMKNTKTIYAGYYGEGGVWRDKYFRQYADSRNGVDADDVLCWIYQHDLPQQPKGE